MAYDVSDGGKDFRKVISPNLAWWHNYKHASLTVWTAFASELWAPLFHNLYPSHEFFTTNCKLPMVTAHFQFLLIAYPTFAEQLKAMCSNQKLKPSMRIAAQDLRFVCEFALPTVRTLLRLIVTYD